MKEAYVQSWVPNEVGTERERGITHQPVGMGVSHAIHPAEQNFDEPQNGTQA